ncbi:glutamate ligase domain-containing protein [Parvularcula oceani]|uniref:glutamate ligase domain-containing protein n=1 Tax=Parvularcula oceani TaxID=1247963 RepID=UPI0004E1EF8E|nr:Mur ligase family protein [Parvularcula oceani]
MKTVLIHGLGVEGRAAAAHFTAHAGMTLLLADEAGGKLDGRPVLREAEAAGRLDAGTLYLRSPGIPPENPLHRAARAAGAAVTTPTGYWLSRLAPRGTITVTGTKGKSTTTALIAAILGKAGIPAAAYGNIGQPPLGPDLPREEVPVVELSSYMMHDLPPGPYRHLVTSLYKEHTDWHGGEPEYRAAKLRPYRFDPPCGGAAPRAVIADEALAGVTAIEDAVPLTGEALILGPHALAIEELGDAFRSPGARAAARAASAILLPMLGPDRLFEALPAAAADWRGLPSRQAMVPSADGRIWIDDALATVPEAVGAALERFCDRPVRLILGGKDRGQRFGSLAPAAKRLDDLAVFAFGEIASRAAGDLAPMAVEHLPSLEEAVRAAAAACPPGGVVLFSPGAPSGPPHRDYKQRATIFAGLASEALPR